MSGFLIALISGALMSIQGVFNTQVTKNTSLWVSSSFCQLTALIVCLGTWYVTDQTSFQTLFQVPRKITLLGGVIGALITITVIKSMNSLGPAKATMLIIIAQLIISWGIELLGMFGVDKQAFSIRKLLGLLIAVAGVITFEL